jgi:branched-chain amino acid transport system ATP-binding protein
MTETTNELALELRGISGGYGHTTVLRGIDMQIPAGAIHCVLGPNGAGKTTLLKTVSGLLKPTSGSVHLEGHNVTAEAPNRRTRRGLCHIPEGRGIFRSLSVRENIRLQVLPGVDVADAVERAAAAFPILGQRLDQRAGTLSGGQQQMLAMTRAYLSSPKLVLVDEASLGLAPLIVEEIFEFLQQIAAQGAALLIVDQFVDRALALSAHAYILNRGQFAFSGSPDEVRDADVFAQYLGAA